jgi:UDP-glucose 4-epimerase
VAKVVANIDYWRDAPLWDAESISKATESWFRFLTPNAQ